MLEKKFYVCERCGNVVDVIHDSGVPMMCCGKKMTKMEPGTVDASVEKHLPVVTVNGTTVTVEVGSVEHPMVEAHSILWVYLQTNKGGQYKFLEVGTKPVATFALADETPVAAYAYCNLHGLWKTDIVEEKVCPVEEAPKLKDEDYLVCKCNRVTYVEIVNSLYENKQLDDVLKIFEKVKDTTHCSTGCGGCYDKVIGIISDTLMG